MFMCIGHIDSLVSCKFGCELLVAGGQLSFRLGCFCMNCMNRSFGAGLDPGCPINSIYHAEISEKFIMISVSQSMHFCHK